MVARSSHCPARRKTWVFDRHVRNREAGSTSLPRQCLRAPAVSAIDGGMLKTTSRAGPPQRDVCSDFRCAYRSSRHPDTSTSPLLREARRLQRLAVIAEGADARALAAAEVEYRSER